MNDVFTIFIIDGDFRDFSEPDLGFIRFDNVTGRALDLLLTLSARRGYQVVLIPKGTTNEEHEQTGDAPIL